HVGGIDQRNAQVVGEREAGERARELEAARHAEPRALVRRHAVDVDAVEGDDAGLVVQRAAQAVDERALARAVGTDQPESLARLDRQAHGGEREEPAEALAQVVDEKERRHGGHFLRSNSGRTKPTRPFGAMITKPTSSRPTMSRLTAEEIVTVTHCCKVPISTAPTSGPTQVVVPPITGMAMLLTA